MGTALGAAHGSGRTSGALDLGLFTQRTRLNRNALVVDQSHSGLTDAHLLTASDTVRGKTLTFRALDPANRVLRTRHNWFATPVDLCPSILADAHLLATVGCGAQDLTLLVVTTFPDGLAPTIDSYRSGLTSTRLVALRNASRLETFGTRGLGDLASGARFLHDALVSYQREIGLADTDLTAVIGTNGIATNTIFALGLHQGVVAAFHNRLTLVTHSSVPWRANAHLFAGLLAIVASAETSFALKLHSFLVGTLADFLTPVVDLSESWFANTDLLANSVMFVVLLVTTA